ncbi:MAG TPA: hypothetical protein DCE78_02295 [Bacteroidetes bacterium]|nr:hypothetical protein [Bacteroidota bacterium]
MNKIQLDLNNITYAEYLKIYYWCKNNALLFTVDYLDWVKYLDTWWVFDHERDAALFALRWL